MAISIVPGSASINVKKRPIVNKPSFRGSQALFTCSEIVIEGQCTITGNQHDNPAGWTLGLIQLKFIDTDWAYYRGRSNGDGSSFLQYSRPPALPKGGCRDTLNVGGIFVDNNPSLNWTIAKAGTPFPIAMSAGFSDAPLRPFDLSRVNGLTHHDNFLREAQTELHFCTVLSLKSPTGTYEHLKTVYWNVHWQARFEPTNFGNLNAPWTVTVVGGLGNMANVSKIIDGPPVDNRFSTIVTAPGTPNCNAQSIASYKSPNVRESEVWTDFNVRQ